MIRLFPFWLGGVVCPHCKQPVLPGEPYHYYQPRPLAPMDFYHSACCAICEADTTQQRLSEAS